MQGAIHSINVSGSGGVPKVSVKATMVNFEGLEGDYNRFRTERKAGDPGRAVCIFSLERIREAPERRSPNRCRNGWREPDNRGFGLALFEGRHDAEGWRRHHPAQRAMCPL